MEGGRAPRGRPRKSASRSSAPEIDGRGRTETVESVGHNTNRTCFWVRAKARSRGWVLAADALAGVAGGRRRRPASSVRKSMPTRTGQDEPSTAETGQDDFTKTDARCFLGFGFGGRRRVNGDDDASVVYIIPRITPILNLEVRRARPPPLILRPRGHALTARCASRSCRPSRTSSPSRPFRSRRKTRTVPSDPTRGRASAPSPEVPALSRGRNRSGSGGTGNAFLTSTPSGRFFGS